MDEFRVMFPGLATELIESVLRSNRGAVDETIDQLLRMSTRKSDAVTNTTATITVMDTAALSPVFIN